MKMTKKKKKQSLKFSFFHIVFCFSSKNEMCVFVNNSINFVPYVLLAKWIIIIINNKL